MGMIHTWVYSGGNVAAGRLINFGGGKYLSGLSLHDTVMPAIMAREWLPVKLKSPSLKNSPVGILSSTSPWEDPNRKFEAAAFSKITAEQNQFGSIIEEVIISDITVASIISSRNI